MANEKSKLTETTKIKIAGYEKEVAQLEQMKDFLHGLNKYSEKGIHIPKGILLYGPPGVGKTVMAKSIADDKVNMIELRAADCTKENSEKFIQAAFERAKDKKPCLLLIDEFDKIAGINHEYYMPMNDKAMKVLLQELDGLKENCGVLVVATCNDIDTLGPALVRSGRFDRIFQINPPSLVDRKKILELYFSKVQLDRDFDLDYIARMTTGYTGAQIESLVNESGIIAIEKGFDKINIDCIQTAMNRSTFHGIEDKIKESEKHMIAVHEAGHAMVALYLKPDCLSNATIIPQGNSKGHTRLIETEDTMCVRKEKDLEDVMIAIGGRAAEMLEFGKTFCGSSDDIRQAVAMLDYLITQCGIFGYEYVISPVRSMVASAKQNEKIVDKRIDILNELDGKVRRIITEHKETFNKIVLGLEDKHLLSREELLACAG